ncbi:hypothetical protein TB2_032789 [Malus domestica]
MHKVMYQFHLKLTCSFRLGQARYKPCSRSLPSRRARGSAERGDRQGKQSELRLIVHLLPILQQHEG